MDSPPLPPPSPSHSRPKPPLVDSKLPHYMRNLNICGLIKKVMWACAVCRCQSKTRFPSMLLQWWNPRWRHAFLAGSTSSHELTLNLQTDGTSWSEEGRGFFFVPLQWNVIFTKIMLLEGFAWNIKTRKHAVALLCQVLCRDPCVDFSTQQ